MCKVDACTMLLDVAAITLTRDRLKDKREKCKDRKESAATSVMMDT